jgi:cytochrome c-type biogenesis protein CcmH/NrfG
MIGLQMVLERDPENIEALYMKGQLMHHLGNVKGAFFALQKAVELAPENPEIQALYAEVLPLMDDPKTKRDPDHKH